MWPGHYIDFYWSGIILFFWLFLKLQTMSYCDGSSNCICNYLNIFFFTFNSNIFLVIYLVLGDAQVYTGLALFLVSENNNFECIFKNYVDSNTFKTIRN